MSLARTSMATRLGSRLREARLIEDQLSLSASTRGNPVDQR